MGVALRPYPSPRAAAPPGSAPLDRMAVGNLFKLKKSYFSPNGRLFNPFLLNGTAIIYFFLSSPYLDKVYALGCREGDGVGVPGHLVRPGHLHHAVHVDTRLQ